MLPGSRNNYLIGSKTIVISQGFHKKTELHDGDLGKFRKSENLKT